MTTLSDPVAVLTKLCESIDCGMVDREEMDAIRALVADNTRLRERAELAETALRDQRTATNLMGRVGVTVGARVQSLEAALRVAIDLVSRVEWLGSASERAMLNAAREALTHSAPHLAPCQCNAVGGADRACRDYRLSDAADGEDWCTHCYHDRSCHETAGEHRKHPNDDYCTFCLSQWPCEEAPEDWAAL